MGGGGLTLAEGSDMIVLAGAARGMCWLWPAVVESVDEAALTRWLGAGGEEGAA
jgi:hypothetical protein